MNPEVLLEMVADAAADRRAVGSMSYGDLRAEVEAVAAGLAGLGVSHVGFVDEYSETLPVLFYAAQRAGLPFVPLNYRLADDALREALVRIAPAVVVVGEQYCLLWSFLGRGGRGPARGRPAVPHRGHLDRLDQPLRRAPDRGAAFVHRGGVGEAGGHGVGDPRDGGADDAGSDPRRPAGAGLFVGRPQADEIRVASAADDPRFLALYRRGDRLVGTITIDRPTQIMKYKRLISKRASWSEALEFAGGA